MKHVIMAAVFVVALAAIGAAQAGNVLDQELIGCVKQLTEAEKNRDVAYFQRTLTDDFTGVTTNGSTEDKGDVLQTARTEAKETTLPKLYDFKVVPLNDSAAVVTYNTVEAGGNPKYQHLSTVWIKHDGQWKLKFRQATPNLWSLND